VVAMLCVSGLLVLTHCDSGFVPDIGPSPSANPSAARVQTVQEWYPPALSEEQNAPLVLPEGGLYTLRMMVDYWRLSTFSASERERMKQVAAKYIVSYDYYTIKQPIIIAASLREEVLLQMAHALVNYDAEMVKRGDTPPELLQETAAKALAGTLEERQYRPYEERRRRRN